MKHRVPALLVAFLLSAAGAWGLVLDVPGEYSTLQTALNAAYSGDTIRLAAGTYTARVATVRDGVTIQGNSTATTRVELSGSGTFLTVRHANITVTRLTVRNAGSTSSNAGIIWESGTGGRVDQVSFESCPQGLITKGSTAPTIDRCTFYNCSNRGIDVQQGSKPKVYNTLLRQCGTSIYVDRGSYTSSPTATIVNNTFVGTTSTTAIRCVRNTTSALVQNNIITGHQYGVRKDTGGALTLKKNNVHGNSTNYLGVTAGSTDISVNPLFVSSTNYHLQDDSPCVDIGENSNSPDHDWDGQSRPMGRGFDLGYDEVQSTTPLYTNADLDGTYAVHDVFALLTGAGAVRRGARSFNGMGSVLVLETGYSGYAQTYDVEPEGAFNYDGGAYTGTIGGMGTFVVHSRYAGPNQDSRISQGYAGFRIATLPGSGMSNASFTGSYSVHGLLGESDKEWWNIFGVALADGKGLMLEVLDGYDAVLHSVQVASGGPVKIDGADNTYASLMQGGGAMFRTMEMDAGDDPQRPAAHKGLGIYVRRQTNASVEQFSGTYRVHEVAVYGNHAQTSGVADVEAHGNGLFTGTMVRNGVSSNFSGLIVLNPSGTFRFNTEVEEEGTMGLNGGLLVATKYQGHVADGGAGNAWMQIWVRTEGGGPTPTDADGDGLTDDEENRLGTSPTDSDTDNDGLADGVDPQPLTRNDTFTAAPASLTFNAVEDEPAPPAQLLTLTNTLHPFFQWSVTANRSWIQLEPVSGSGDGECSVRVNSSSLSATGSPHTGTITVTAPGMTNSPRTIPVTVHVERDDPDPQPILSVSPLQLEFLHYLSSPLPAAKTVQISNAGDGTLTWTAAPQAAWLQVNSTGGTGARTVSVSVNTAGLAPSLTPYVSTVRVTAPGALESPKDVTVRLTVRPSHALNTPFPVAYSAGAQTLPQLAHDNLNNRYAVLWNESGRLYVQFLDGNTLPVGGPVDILDYFPGTSASACIVANPLQDSFWVIYDYTPPGGTSDVLGRVIGLGGGVAGGAFFNVDIGTAAQRNPSAAYNAARSEIVVAYETSQPGNYDVRAVRLNAATAATVGSRYVVEKSGLQGSASVAVDPTRNQGLVCWIDKSSTEGHEVLRARKVSAVDLTAIGSEFAVSAVTGLHAAPKASYDPLSRRYVVMWESGDGTAGEKNILSARITSGSAASFVTAVDLAALPGNQQECAHTLFSSGFESYACWADTGLSPAAIRFRRISSPWYRFGSVASVPTGGQAQSQPAVVANASNREFLVAWVDGRDTPAQIYAMRTAAGLPDTDADGLPDEWEQANGLDHTSSTGDNGPDGDPDGDGVGNRNELYLSTSPTDSDSDDDGLTDGQEDRNGSASVDSDESDPTLADTDGDGFSDGAEWFLNSNGLDGAVKPPAAVFLIEHGPWQPGTTQTVRIHVTAITATTLTLGLNPGEGDWNPPAGWAATPVGERMRAVPAGSHVFDVNVTPPDIVSAANAAGLCAFRVTGTNAFQQTLTAVFMCDGRSTLAGMKQNADTLALRYAPVLRLHRQFYYQPMAVEAALALSVLNTAAGRQLAGRPGALDLYQSAHNEASLDFDGTTTALLRQAYSGLANPDPVAYYTVARLGGEAVDTGGSPDDIVIQYYYFFFADEWGATTAGGHSHEGDWEMVQILLDAQAAPKSITATQQWLLARDAGAHGAGRAPWDAVQKMGGTHPVVFVGEGGHSLYLAAGSRRYAAGLEVHDGLGAWILPHDGVSPLVTTPYPLTVAARLEPLGRLGETMQPLWLRYAGLWGRRNLPAAADDLVTASTTSGSQGPAFLGTGSGVFSAWLDPHGWSEAAEALSVPLAMISGTLPAELASAEVTLLDATGGLYRSLADASGAFSIEVPEGTYQLAAYKPANGEVEAVFAMASFNLSTGEETLFPATAPVTNLGTMTRNETRLRGTNVYALHDADGDGQPDSADPDADNDGQTNSPDGDGIGDGFLDSYQRQDPDRDGIPSYFDSDDDNDGIPDTEDTDRNGNGIPDSNDPRDTDKDGFIDAVDTDIDNDGASNTEEVLAGSDPFEPRDTPDRLLGDLDANGTINAIDVQGVVNMALKLEDFAEVADFNDDGNIGAVDVQSVINRALGLLPTL